MQTKYFCGNLIQTYIFFILSCFLPQQKKLTIKPIQLPNRKISTK